ncbi:hypothetical protein [Streptomyces sp. NBC_00207]|uniref:golvesin C-terminal-like domain-containing protein n=1 Tax=Streptomyces sp. NBC_00207 TaxID=2903635 RepID=UPI003251794B
MKRRTAKLRAPAVMFCSATLIAGLIQSEAWAEPGPTGTSLPAANPASPSQVPPADREKLLGKEWKSSTDRAWTTSGDAAGFHVLVADQKAGYGWRTAATLAEPGFDADMWIGNACVTGSGRRAVVAYAPRTFTNKPELMARGAFTAVVDLDSGAVTKLDRQASLAYFSPGCGTGETAVLTQAGGDTRNQTRLLTVDAAGAKVSRTTELAGQVTSAVPVGKAIVAADAARLTRIDEQGRRTAIAHTGQVPFGLKADAEGGLVYLDRPAGSTDKGEVKRISATDIARGDADKTKQSVLARGALTRMDLSSSADGAVVITGDTKAAEPLPKTVQRRPDVPKESQVTTGGKALVTKVAAAGEGDPRKQDPAAESKKISLKVLATGKDTQFTVTPSLTAEKAAAGTAPSPALAPAAPQSAAPAAKSAPALAAAQAASPAEDERYCSVARNDPAKQAMQPKPRQVEWAVDQIVNGTLDKNVSRPANWKNLGMAAYQPQTLFPRLGLHSGGRIPAQVLLGITAQESNMWQASRVVVPGVTGNPLIGNYYGIKYAASGQQTDPWGINWAEADCGYGVTQITDGMRVHGKEKTGELPLTTLQQEAAALDYTANIAAGQRVLADKWNVTTADGLKVNNGDPKYLENWFFALWAYNSGYYPKAAAASNGGLWGVGFTNNPANPLWKANRTPFLEGPAGANDYSHAKHPQDWPYQEKVLGWAARPLEALESPGKMVAGFREAWWTSPALRSTVKPAENLFCTAANSCDPSKIGPNDKNEPGLGACTRSDLKCWWNQPVTWKDCTTKAECGNELMRFDDTYKEEADGTAYPPNCTAQGLPANALVVDDAPAGTSIHRPGCSPPKPDSGTFNLDFATPSAKIDLHQIGAGYNSHFWFGHTRKPGDLGGRMKVTGTWKLSAPMTGGAEVFVHLPDHGAQATLATYNVKSITRTDAVVVNQVGTGNRWVSLGEFNFKGVIPEVSLSTDTPDGTGDKDIAFDAVAFAPKNITGGVPQIKLPPANPNAPDITNYGEDPHPLPGISPTMKSAPSGNCQPMQGQIGRTMCVQSAPHEGPSAVQDKFLKNAPQDAPGVRAAGVSVSCSTNMRVKTFTRFNACASTDLNLIVLENNVPLGTAQFQVDHNIQLDRTKAQIFQSLTVTPIKIQDTLGTVSLKLDFNCTRRGKTFAGGATVPDKACPVKTATIVSPTWAAGQTGPASLSAWQDWESTAPTKANNDMLDLSWTVTATVPRGSSVPHTWAKPGMQVRCDNEVGGSTGCVFHEYTPDFPIDYAKHPVAAALYWMTTKKLAGGKYAGSASYPGSKSRLSPLTRNSSESVAKTNRGRMCSKSAKNFTSNPPGMTCDEYPFARSRQSGGYIVDPATGKNIIGAECAQFSAIVSDQGTANEKWTLHYDDNYSLPKWDEPCARGSIPGPQNTGAGGDLGRFVTAVRLIDEDRYYVTVKELDACDPNSVCTPMP